MKKLLKFLLVSTLRYIRPGIGQLGTHSPRPLDLQPNTINNPINSKDYPKISIVVPSYNQGGFIEATLCSIINENYPNLELIVVDGNSTDNTIDILKRYETHFSWWISEADSGQTEAINKGFMRSTGEVMAWINSDDLIAPGTLHLIAKYFTNYPQTHAIYGNRILINEENMEIGRWILPSHSDEVLKYADFIPQETLYWSREAWKTTGGMLDETFQFAMDWDFLLRLSKNKLSIVHLDVFLGLFRIHNQQKTSSQLLSIGQEEIQRIRMRELGFQPTPWQLRLKTIPFLINAKYRELGFMFGLNRKLEI